MRDTDLCQIGNPSFHWQRSEEGFVEDSSHMPAMAGETKLGATRADDTKH